MGEGTATKTGFEELKRVGIIAQKQNDLFLIRIRTVAGDLTAEELIVLARVCEKYGSGRVHLTTRQAVEIHNIHIDDLRSAREELEQNGIVLGVCGPRGRGIVACPGSATCTSGIRETKSLAAELDSVYFRRQAPHKFKIAVSGCPNNCSKPVENDVGIMGVVLPAWDAKTCISCRLCVSICPAEAVREQDRQFLLNEEKCLYCGLCIRNCPTSAWKPGKTGYSLYLGGTMGIKPRLGTRAKILIQSEDELLEAVRSAFAYYLANGRKRERFGHMLDRIGTDKAFADIFSSSRGESPLRGTGKTAESRKNFLDLRGVCCPINFVKAKLAMEKIRGGETIEFYLDDGEPIVNVTRSMKDAGHEVLLVTPKEGYFEVLVEKKN